MLPHAARQSHRTCLACLQAYLLASQQDEADAGTDAESSSSSSSGSGGGSVSGSRCQQPEPAAAALPSPPASAQEGLRYPAPATCAMLAATGAAAGLASGLLGVGGGVVVTPLLALLMPFPQATVLGTSLLAMIPPASVALLQHQRWAPRAADAVGAR
jgi:hypothetical protein